MSSHTDAARKAATIFKERFLTTPLMIRSPGRVNLIGEHTDYNGGFVLPAAIDKAIYVAAGISGSDACCYIAADIDEEYVQGIHNLVKEAGHWSGYINGVVEQLQNNGYKIRGFNCVISGDIPPGAGMSSSAAVECGVIFALNKLFGLGITVINMVQMAKKAENEYVGVQCGIMDQFASMFGKDGQVIKLDCRSLAYEYKPFNMQGIRIVLFDTNVKHSLASSEYNTRRLQCEQGVALLQAHHPQVSTLRDATMAMLEAHVMPVDKIIFDRCKYVVEEIQRLQEACTDLENNDVGAFGKKMFATHSGLSELYDVSCKELDFLTDFVKNEPAVLGARMMGGGFGGCTINLVKEDMVDALAQKLAAAYKQKFGLDMKVHIASLQNGTSILNLE